MAYVPTLGVPGYVPGSLPDTFIHHQSHYAFRPSCHLYKEGISILLILKVGELRL